MWLEIELALFWSSAICVHVTISLRVIGSWPAAKIELELSELKTASDPLGHVADKKKDFCILISNSCYYE